MEHQINWQALFWQLASKVAMAYAEQRPERVEQILKDAMRLVDIVENTPIVENL
jgi:hypothetical protein